jgi:hypothetical protein
MRAPGSSPGHRTPRHHVLPSPGRSGPHSVALCHTARAPRASAPRSTAGAPQHAPHTQRSTARAPYPAFHGTRPIPSVPRQAPPSLRLTNRRPTAGAPQRASHNLRPTSGALQPALHRLCFSFRAPSHAPRSGCTGLRHCSAPVLVPGFAPGSRGRQHPETALPLPFADRSLPPAQLRLLPIRLTPPLPARFLPTAPPFPPLATPSRHPCPPLTTRRPCPSHARRSLPAAPARPIPAAPYLPLISARLVPPLHQSTPEDSRTHPGAPRNRPANRTFKPIPQRRFSAAGNTNRP